MFFYLFFRPVLSVRNIDVLHKGRESLAEILVLGMSVWLPVLIIAGSFISYTESYVKYLVIISPEILFLVMILPRLRFLLSKQYKWERHDLNLARTFSQMALFIIMYIAVCLVFTDISISESSTSKLIWIAAIFACDTVLVSLLALIDKKSRFVGEGGASYFGNLRYFLEVLIPPVATLIFAVIFARTKLALVAAYTLLSITVPYFAANEIRKSTDSFEVAGLVTRERVEGDLSSGPQRQSQRYQDDVQEYQQIRRGRCCAAKLKSPCRLDDPRAQCTCRTYFRYRCRRRAIHRMARQYRNRTDDIESYQISYHL